MNEFIIKIQNGNNFIEVPTCAGRSLLDILLEAGIYIDSPCGGLGRCGKCAVLFTENPTDITDEDRDLILESDLSQGKRLACRSFPKKDCAIYVDEISSKEIDAVSDFLKQGKNSGDIPADQAGSALSYGVAIDIGTTTIAVALIDGNGDILNAQTFLNRQRSYGSDVISRINAANKGRLGGMSRMIKIDLYNAIKQTASKAGVPLRKLSEVAIAGNTTMLHILMGYSCENLGRYPFTPITLSEIKTDFRSLFSDTQCPAAVTILPGISAFIGADISAGLLHCGFYSYIEPAEDITSHHDNFTGNSAPARDHITAKAGGEAVPDINAKQNKSGEADASAGRRFPSAALFVDLGTNAEMALACRGRIFTASAAAGPAFEGGNISCGMPSISGAICSVRINGGSISYETINNAPPLGICGTGVVELICELLENNLIDKTGLLIPEYFEDGFVICESPKIILTQSDIRQLQLAKAAVRAGIDTLLLNCGIGPEDVEKIYIAGGFGCRINIEKAIAIGLLPKEFAGKTIAAGNTSLGGCADYIARRLPDKKSPADKYAAPGDHNFADMTAESPYDGRAVLADYTRMDVSLQLSAIIKSCTEVSLAESETFKLLYIEKMSF